MMVLLLFLFEAVPLPLGAWERLRYFLMRHSLDLPITILVSHGALLFSQIIQWK